jgi:hypothetical protein
VSLSRCFLEGCFQGKVSTSTLNGLLPFHSETHGASSSLDGYREFAAQQQALRTRALDQARVAEGQLHILLQRFSACSESFQQSLSNSPLRAILQYGHVRSTIFDQRDHLLHVRKFLAQAKPGERLGVGNEYHDRARVACDLLKSHQKPVDFKGAIAVLTSQIDAIDKQAAALSSARELIVSQARLLLHCVRELEHKGLIVADDAAAIALQEVLSLLFWPESAHERTQAKRMASSPAGSLPLTRFFAETSAKISAHANSLTKVAITCVRRDVLKNAARQLAGQVMSWRPPVGLTRCERAILGLHFSFTSNRQGLGTINKAQLSRWESELEAYDVLEAVRSLIRRELLQQEDFDVFRYVPSVWGAVARLRR